MRSFQLPDTPFWALYRLKSKQMWPGHRVRRAALAFLCVLAAQAVVSYVVVSHAVVGTLPAFAALTDWVRYAASSLGLFSPLWAALLAPTAALSAGIRHTHIWASLGLAGTATQFVMPAFAALPVAPDRASGRVDEWRMAGLRPSQVLAASAMASLLPFALFVLAAVGVAGIASLWTLAAAGAGGGAAAAAQIPGWGYLALYCGAFLMHAVILVAASALCRRSFTALAVCYALQFVVLSAGRYAVVVAALRFGVLLASIGTLWWSAASLALETPAMLLLVRLALRSLARTGRQSV